VPSAQSLEWYVDEEPDEAPRALDESESSIGVDHSIVRLVRDAVTELLATRLQASPVSDPAVRRELARALTADVLATRSVQRAHAGLSAWTASQEFAISDAVMAALFGLGRLQPLVDDTDIENIEANGCDDVWLSYADGRQERGPAIAGSDAELIELIQSLGARTGSSEGHSPQPVPACTSSSTTAAGSRRWHGPRRDRRW
jgi:hypothetical protein